MVWVASVWYIISAHAFVLKYTLFSVGTHLANCAIDFLALRVINRAVWADGQAVAGTDAGVEQQLLADSRRAGADQSDGSDDLDVEAALPSDFEHRIRGNGGLPYSPRLHLG